MSSTKRPVGRPKKRKTVITYIRLPEDLYLKVDKAAKREHGEKSAVIIRILREHFQRKVFEKAFETGDVSILRGTSR